MPRASSAKPFKSLKAAMRRKPRAGSLLSVIFPGHDCISRSRHAPAAGGRMSTFPSGGRSRLGGTASREGFLAPFLQSRPHLGKGTELCAAANEDGDFALHRVGVVGGLAHIFDVFEFAFQDFLGIVKNDQTIPRKAARAPQKISLMAAEGWRQSVAAAKEIDGPRLPVVLREDAAARPFFEREPAVSLIYAAHELFPSEFIGEMLREDRAHVAVLAAWNFERQVIHVGNEFINGEHRHHNRGKPRSSGYNQHYDRGLQPDLTRSCDETLDHHRSCCQEGWIDWREIVVLALENDEYGKGCQIAPAEEPVRFQTRRK